MKTVLKPTPPKRPFNLLLNEETVQQARSFTSNLSATVDSLQTDYVTMQNEALSARQNLGDTVADAWNQFHTAQGSFADDYSTYDGPV
jgi:post-segregation antitoxin (ccd killing protein)